MRRHDPLGRQCRRVVVPLVLASLLVTACAGGGDSDGTAQPTPPPATTSVEPDGGDPECPTGALETADGPVQIEIWHTMSATNGQVFEALVADYNARQDAVQVSASFQGGYADAYTKYLNTLRTGGDLPDLLMMNETAQQQLVDSESIVAIGHCVDSDRYDLSDFSPKLVDQYRLGGVLVSMPFQLSNPVLFYDGADLVAAGLDPDAPPRTFSELLDTCRTLVGRSVVEHCIALDVDGSIFEQWLNMAGAALVDNDNGRSARATHAFLDSQAATETYAFLTTLRDGDLIINTGRGTDQAEIGRFLAVGFNQATFTIGSSASLGEIYNQIGNFPGIDVRVGRFPGPNVAGTAIGGGSIYLTTPTSDAQRAAAWDLVKWLNEPDQQITWSTGTGYIPTRASAVEDPRITSLWEERPGFRVAYDQLDGPPPPGGGGPVIGDHLGVREAIEQSLERLYSGTDPADAQAFAQAQANKAIEDYNRRIGG
jgi:sn-glycerol 3-phosphate transport system substrate-binding protein